MKISEQVRFSDVEIGQKILVLWDHWSAANELPHLGALFIGTKTGTYTCKTLFSQGNKNDLDIRIPVYFDDYIKVFIVENEISQTGKGLLEHFISQYQ